jgi:hypothetical protein
MTKGPLKKTFTSQTTHRIPKIATLALSMSVLVAMIAIDASASPNDSTPSISVPDSGNYSILATESSLNQLFRPGNHHPARPNQPTTTTTVAAPPTTTSTVSVGGGGGGSAPTTTTTTPPPTTTTTTPPPTTTTTTAPASTTFPIGVADSSQPSGYDPPGSSALSGYTESYETDFPGNSLPAGWDTYSGTPGGDPGGQFGGASHAVVGNGMLSLKTFQDPNYGNEWVTGGVCDCGVSPTYGAYFVRSRVTGPGPTNVELLYPNSGWPPEIDFNETSGTTSASMATVHWGASNSQYHSYENIDLTQWHTWGVIWTPTSITYTIDGQVWSTVTSSDAEIPNVPMHLALQQQTWCGATPAYACPTAPESMQINWVAVYTPNS